ncbi:hypothetical protein HBH59_045800 [Parastagonospora nodorum]|nr:hypothetical protein HBH59_045800 [Parastagonospora nodorum]
MSAHSIHTIARQKLITQLHPPLSQIPKFSSYTPTFPSSSTYDHRTLTTRLPVRSAIFKQRTGGLVVKWVTISESPLLYVFAVFLFGSGR